MGSCPFAHLGHHVFHGFKPWLVVGRVFVGCSRLFRLVRRVKEVFAGSSGSCGTSHLLQRSSRRQRHAGSGDGDTHVFCGGLCFVVGYSCDRYTWICYFSIPSTPNIRKRSQNDSVGTAFDKWAHTQSIVLLSVISLL